MQIRKRALDVLALVDPAAKCAALDALCAQSQGWGFAAPAAAAGPAESDLPGRPPKPRLIDPGAVPTRSPFTREGLAALVHAIAHIEFNAINLALDAVWRFDGMPEPFYRDWIKGVASRPRASSVRGTKAMRATTSCAVREHIRHRPSWASKSP